MSFSSDYKSSSLVDAKRKDLLANYGSVALNTRYPKEFELYVIALELLNSDKSTRNYFIFPVMPSSIKENITQLHTIKQSFGGVSVLSSNIFTPLDINLTGNFGRKFRVLLGVDYVDLVSSFTDKSVKKTLLQAPKKTLVDFFDKRVKTGFGCTKVLEELIQDSKAIDSGGARTLILHNLAFGNSYVVKPMSYEFHQSQESNMIWNYNLSLKAIAPISSLYTSTEVTKINKRLAVNSIIQRNTQNVLNSLTGFVNRNIVDNIK